MIDALIAGLSKELELSAEEIADTIWLALQIQESQSESTATEKFALPQPTLKRGELEREISPETQSEISDSGERNLKQSPDEPKAGIYPRRQDEILLNSGLSFKVPDAPSLREPLTLARALKPLMRRIPSGTTLVFDEAATTQKIADEGLWLPVLRPTLEPWFDLELVVDESISMQIWRPTIRELERLLKNYGIFRDVRIWGLIADNLEQVQIRRGIGATAKNQSPRSPAELIDPSGRRLVLVVSDCVSSLWRNGKVANTLEIWAKQGSMAIVQMLPKWLWKRTALGRASEVRLQGLNPGEFNQKLIAKEVSLWDDLEEMRGVKVPVFTLEPEKVSTWAQMLSGKGSIWTSGYVFKLDATPASRGRELFGLDYSQLSAEQRVQAFRVTASPMARKLAGLLAAAPAISLPIVRLIQDTLLKESQQVHVAEVFLGGLLRSLSEINAETNPNYVQYEFMDGVRELLVDSVPSGYVLNVVDEVSKYVARKAGLSLEDFAAVLRNPQQVGDSNIAGNIGYFATVTAQVLRRLGGEYDRFADSLQNNIAVDNLKTEIEQNRYFIGQKGNIRIYCICTDKPWFLPFDALIIPSGDRINLQGSFAQSLKDFLGEESFRLICVLINKAREENNQSAISPESPLLVSLPSGIKSQFPQIDISQSNHFLIFATVEALEPTVAGAFKATKAIIIKIAEQGITRVVLPLLGTGNNGLPINEVAIAMLSAITQSLNNLPSNSIKEIILVEQEQSAVEIINKFAQNLLAQENTDKVDLLSEVGTDYTQLRNLLEAGKWREADEETARLMLQASGYKERDWLDEEDMKAFPSIDLQTIDQLWSKYSNGRFGFSVQKRIWLSLGGKPGYYDDEIYNKFGETVGWYIKDEDYWLHWRKHTFGLDAPQGHLPRYLPSQQKRIRHYLFYRNDLQVQLVNYVSIQDKIRQNKYDNSIRIIGDRCAGKTTFMAALAYLQREDSEIPFRVYPQNEESKRLFNDTQDILMQGSLLPPTNPTTLEELPFYSFNISLKPSLFVQPISALRSQNIEMNISFREYPGELFHDLRSNRSDSYAYSSYLDDCANVSKLLFLIDGTTRDDRGYRTTCIRLSEEIANRLDNNREILSQYRIAVVISKCEEPLLWNYRHNVKKIMNLKFPETQSIFENWSQLWGCKIYYFACSSFGVMGNPLRPNFRVIRTDKRGIIGTIEKPSQWKPFGLLAPIYWLHTGKNDPRLQQ